MSSRIGFDIDGVLADFASAFYEVEARLFGERPMLEAEPPEREAEERPAGEDTAVRKSRDAETPYESRRRREAVWAEIQVTPDFWTSLRPLSKDAIPRIQQLAVRDRWEVFFITQRPATAGDTVQRQTQRWLVAQGFELPSVLVIAASRGAAAAALKLDYHVDDSAQNCLDVMTDSGARAILVSPGGAVPDGGGVRKLGIAVVRDIDEALDILEQASAARGNQGLLRRLATMVGWK
jgi:hypothetical protein